MEIRDPVHGSIYYSDAEVGILDTPEYQRLRKIKQLGFSEFSYPGATHNRYIHSLGVCHLSGLAFDSIFRAYHFHKPSSRQRFRQTLRLAALLHDLGHGPLSHTTEQVMPAIRELKISLPYLNRDPHRKATHEDYTLKYITESNLAKVIKERFTDIDPYMIACLIDRSLPYEGDFFLDSGFDFRPILSQIVSSELDVDRMDYLERDSYFCGTNYGRIDLGWLVQNLTFYRQNQEVYLALNRRALYAFDDFLISRHHMYLMVYFHHKSIIYEEILNRYLTSADCKFFLPGNIDEYTHYNDYKLNEHLSQSDNPWSKRIAERRPYKVLLELHNTRDSQRPEQMKKALEKENLDVIWSSSKARLSKYHAATPESSAKPIFVVDQYDLWDEPRSIEQTTEIFQKYEGARIIDRLYVPPEDAERAEKILRGMSPLR